jgi:hypothetical protein
MPEKEKAMSTPSRDGEESERLLRERLAALEEELSAIYIGDKREVDIPHWLQLALEKAEAEESLLQLQRQLITRYGRLLLEESDKD